MTWTATTQRRAAGDDPPHGPPPPRSLATMLLPRSWRRGFGRREIVLLDLDGLPDLDAAAKRGPTSLSRFPLGAADDVRERLAHGVPELLWRGRCGSLIADGGRLFLQLREHGLVDTLRLEAAGPAVDRWLAAVCGPAGWSAWDVGAGRFCSLHPTAEDAQRAARIARYPDNVVPLRS